MKSRLGSLRDDLRCRRRFVRCALGIRFHFGRIGNVDPDVNVWRAAIMPDEGGSFQSPVIPDAILAQILIAEEG